MRNRIKNPYFWIGLVGVILTALQVEASSLTTWESVIRLVVDTLCNPYLLVTTIMAVSGVFIDPTTTGIKDKREIGEIEGIRDLDGE